GIVAQGTWFSLSDVEVAVATIDLEELKAYCSVVSHGFQAAKSKAKHERIERSFELSSEIKD
ncbi:MAG: glutamine-dependent NAD(+) synthetase, partial [Sclerophora amabilis]